MKRSKDNNLLWKMVTQTTVGAAGVRGHRISDLATIDSKNKNQGCPEGCESGQPKKESPGLCSPLKNYWKIVGWGTSGEELDGVRSDPGVWK